MLDTGRVKDEVSAAVAAAVSRDLFFFDKLIIPEKRRRRRGVFLIWPSPHPPNLYFRMRAMSTIIDLSATYVSVGGHNSMKCDQFVNMFIFRLIGLNFML